MESISKRAYAKINLTLDVIKKLENGYHELNMIMQQISMFDVITITKDNPNQLNREDIIINCNKNIGQMKDNIIYKACMLMKERYGINSKIDVYLEKNIFLSAGLAGGSTDCATTLICLNELFELNISKEELMKIGEELGKDVVYCLNGGLVFATGTGVDLQELKNYQKTYLVVANPNFEVSTKEVFKNFRFDEQVKTDYTKVFDAINENNINKLASGFNNMLESVTINKYPIIGQIKSNLIINGAIGSLMSGSGATVFGMFTTEEEAIIGNNELLKAFPKISSCVCHTL